MARFVAAGDALPHDGPALATLSTLVFAAIVAMQMVNAFHCRSTDVFLFARRSGNRLLDGAVLTELLLLLTFLRLG